MKRISNVSSNMKNRKIPTLRKQVPKTKETLLQKQISSLLPKDIHNVEDPLSYLTELRAKATTKQENFHKIIREPYFFLLKKRIFDYLENDPDFSIKHDYEMTLDDYRNYTNLTLFKVLKGSNITFDELKNNPNILKYLNEIAGSFNTSTATKFVVHLGLYCNTIKALGTDKHYKFYRRGLEMKDLGCFLMTEMGHGSNVQGIVTTAHYLHSQRAFYINTPHETGMKFWIGNLARTANYGVCFANMIVQDINYGVHVFIIKLRDEKGQIYPGIEIGDCGHKMGMNGIDNGWAIFRRQKIPYDNLLDKYSQIDEKGNFVSSIKKNSDRFATQLLSLSGGRLIVANASCFNTMFQSAVTIKYLSIRKQFGSKKYAENTLINYPSVQERLIPNLSKAIVYQVLNEYLYKAFYDNLKNIMDIQNKTVKEIHALSSFNKIASTYNNLTVLNTLRELCGGHGYSEYSYIATSIKSLNVQITWEGANDILIQQTAKFLLTTFSEYIQKGKILYKSFNFLKDFENDEKIELELKSIKKYLENVDSKNFETKILFSNLKRLFQWRLKLMIEVCAERFALNLENSKNKSLFEAFNKSLPNALIDASYFYGDYNAILVFERKLERLNKSEYMAEYRFLWKMLLIFAIKSITSKSSYLTETLSVQSFASLDRITLDMYPTMIPNLLILSDSVVDNLPDLSVLASKDGRVYESLLNKARADGKNKGNKFNKELFQKIRNAIPLN